MRTNTATIERESTPATSAEQKPTTAKRSGGLNFGGISLKKSSGKKEYPILPDDLGTAGDLAREARNLRDQIESLDGEKKTTDADLMALVYQWYWKHHSGKTEIPSSVIVKIPAQGDEPESKILVTIPARYKSVDVKELETSRARIISSIGEQNFEGFFRDAFVIKVNGDLIPSENHQDFINELSALCQKFNCLDALEATPTIKSTSEFPAKRHQVLTVEENTALNQVYPIIPMIKTKGIE